MLGNDWKYREAIYADDICGSCGCELSKCRQCGLIDCEYSHPKDEVCPDGFMGKKDRKDAAKAEELRREGLTE